MPAPMGEGEGGEKATAANHVDASRLPKMNDKIQNKREPDS